MSPWRGRVNAEIYDRFVREHKIYRHLNRRLVELARVGGARRVLDLACGTGATALACLRVLGPDADLVGADASEAVVEVARANVLDPRARFVVAPAAAVDRVLSGPFDRAVCNAAFWQFPAPGTVLRRLSNLLSPGAVFAFNVPAERVVDEPAPIHPFQIALARAIEARSHRPFPATPIRLDPDGLEKLMREAGLHVERRERFVYEARQSEMIELMKIPAMLDPLAPGLSEGERLEALEEAASRIDPRESVQVPWIYFVATKRP